VHIVKLEQIQDKFQRLISANITREITKVKQYIYKTYKHGPKKII